MHKNKLIFLFNFVNHVCEFTQSVISTEVWRSIRRKYNRSSAQNISKLHETPDRQHTAARQLQQQGTAVTSLHFGLRVKYVHCTSPAVTLLLQ